MKKALVSVVLLGIAAYCALATMDRMAGAAVVSAGGSSTFRRVEYDPRTAVLRVTFTGGSVYEYLGVAPEHGRRMVLAPGKGSYYNQHIRGQYARRRVVAEAGACPCCAPGSHGDGPLDP